MVGSTLKVVCALPRKEKDAVWPSRSARPTATSVIAGVAGCGVLTETGAVAVRASTVTELSPLTLNCGTIASETAPVLKL